MTRYDHEAFTSLAKYGAVESVLPAHPANGTAITWWRAVTKRGAMFDLGNRVQEAMIRENAR